MGLSCVKTPVIAIVGPTGIGKSSIAQRLAQQQGVGVLSADSMQVYQGMDIGTAKLSQVERLVPHLGLDLAKPSESYSAAEYQSYAKGIIESEAAAKGGVPPVVCGGTGLYLRAALDDFTFAGVDAEDMQQQEKVRAKYEEMHEHIGSEKLHELLASHDPKAAAEIHPNNVRRVIRAFELWETGRSYSEVKQAFKQRKSYYPTMWIGLTCERDQLYERINQRVDVMMEQGLLSEVEGLLNQGYREALTAQQAIGYKELVPVLEGQVELDYAVAAIKQASRRYAKRQLSWFRSDPRIQWVSTDDRSEPEILQFVVEATELAEHDAYCPIIRV